MPLSLLWRYGRRCGQGRLHQPGNKTGTCNISSNVVGRDYIAALRCHAQHSTNISSEILATLYRFPTCTNEVASYSNSILVPVGDMRQGYM